MKREDLLSKISDPSKVWDVVVIGGGATGLGIVSLYSNGKILQKQLPVVVPSWCMEESGIWLREMFHWYWRLCTKEDYSNRMLRIW